MSETIRESTRKRARKIERIVNSGGSIPARYAQLAIHFIVARASEEARHQVNALRFVYEENQPRKHFLTPEEIRRYPEEDGIYSDAANEVRIEIKKRGLDLNQAWYLFDYYHARMYPMYSFLLRLQDNAL